MVTCHLRHRFEHRGFDTDCVLRQADSPEQTLTDHTLTDRSRGDVTKLTCTQREYFSREAKKMDALTRAIQELHFDFTEIVLAELSGKAFETHQWLGWLGTKRSTRS
jgi:hypothetical protein